MKIPESWESVEIGDILTLGGGRDYKHLDVGDIPVYGTGGYMTSVNEYLYNGESVGIGRKGTIDKPVFLKGKFWTVDTLFYTHSFKNTTPYFVYILFQNINWRKYSEATGVPSLSRSIIEPIKINLPPLPEQQKIAEILSTVDAKIEIVDQQIAETQELKKGLMQQLLTKGIGHTEFKDSVLGKIPKSWEVLKVGDTCSLKGGFAFKSSDSCEHGIRWVKIANVGVNKIKWNDESFLPHGFEIQHRDFVLNEGDIILAMTRPILNGKLKIARISKFDSGSLLNQRVGRILENNNLNKDFAYQVFNSFLFISAMEKELVGTDPPNISSSMFEELNIALPPLKEQVEIAEILTSYDQKLEVLSEKKTTYQELKQGLMQQLLTGKMRV
jgi:type I restriction enzyme S subunit